MKYIVFILLAVISIISISAVCAGEVKEDFEVPLTESAFSRCQNGIREPSESCDLGNPKKGIPPGEDLCPALGKILGIVQVCRSEACACLPDRMDCGNGIREGAEWCDPGDKEKEPVEKNDKCPQLSELLGRPMVCNKNTCLCTATTDITANVTCGDGKIEFNEECEEDSDCDEGLECKNCKCITKIEINQSKIIEKLSESDIPSPEEKAEEKKAVEMQEKKEFDYHDLVGKTIPDLFYGDFEKSYTNVEIRSSSEPYIIGVRTRHNVIQEILDAGYEEPDMLVFVSEDEAKAIIASTDRLDALDTALGEGKITYRPAGIFGRMWFWVKGIFR